METHVFYSNNAVPPGDVVELGDTFTNKIFMQEISLAKNYDNAKYAHFYRESENEFGTELYLYEYTEHCNKKED